MDTMFEYLKWRSDLSFNKSKLNEVDFALFSQIILTPFTLFIDMSIFNDNEYTLEKLSQLTKQHKDKFVKKMGLITPPEILDIVIQMGESPRFKDLVIHSYISDICINREVQFTAMTIDLDESTRVVVYSGTDDNLISWKEDFNMMFTYPTEAQKSSIKYLEKNYGKEKTYVVGHSKGGNLAIYSTLNVSEEVFNTISKVYCFDAPGLSEQVELNKENKRRFKKIYGYAPQTSIIGRLFYHYENDVIVNSGNLGLYQHDLLSWEVERDHFKRLEKRDSDCEHIENKISGMLDKMSPVIKEEFVEIGYGLFMRTNAGTLTEAYNSKMEIVKQYMNIKKEDRKILENILFELFMDKIVVKNVYFIVKETLEKNKVKKKYIKSNEK